MRGHTSSDKKERCLIGERGEGERDNGIIYFDIDAVFFLGGGGFIGGGGYLGCVVFTGSHVCWLECAEGKGDEGIKRMRLDIFYY